MDINPKPNHKPTVMRNPKILHIINKKARALITAPCPNTLSKNKDKGFTLVTFFQLQQFVSLVEKYNTSACFRTGSEDALLLLYNLSRAN